VGLGWGVGFRGVGQGLGGVKCVGLWCCRGYLWGCLVGGSSRQWRVGPVKEQQQTWLERVADEGPICSGTL
jgi:hypothetical protein